MSGSRALLVSLGAAAAITVFLLLWWRWPLALGLGTGALLGGLVLMTSVSLGADPAEADAAWREAAPDLVEDPGGPSGSPSA